MTPAGAIIHHPTSSQEAIRIWNNLHTRLREERPGYILWALSDDLDTLNEHLQKQPEGGIYRIVPFLIAPGKHFQEDIARVENVLKKKRPDLRYERSPALLENPQFLNFWIGQL